MLIKFSEIVAKYGKPKGIIHIGAHLMEERNDYLSFGLDNTIWIEANLNLIKQISNLKGEKEKVFNYAITDVDNEICDLKITNNGQSSSLLDLKLHLNHHPHIHVVENSKVITRRMDTLLNDEKITIHNYDFLNIDVQGVELLVLKSFGKLLENIKYIYTEINTDYLYENCTLLNEIDSYLETFGFLRVETSMTQYQWGDALYMKK